MKYKYLEYLRTFAALTVFVNHIVGKLPYLTIHKSVALQSISAWGTEAVILFFLLSGIVINHTVKKYGQNTKVFLKKRALRILPIYYFCIFFALLIDYFTHYTSNSTSNYWGSLFFVATLQGSITSPISTIAVVWSLSFEIFFYVVFAFTIGKNQLKLLIIWLLLSLISIFFYYVKLEDNIIRYFVLMFSFSSLWLFGYFIYEFRQRFDTNFSTAIFAFSMIPLINRLQISPQFYDIIIYLVTAVVCFPIFIFALNNNDKVSNHKVFTIRKIYYLPIYLIAAYLSITFSKSLMISKGMYLSIPLISLILLNERIEKQIKIRLRSIERFMLFVASISYALYLVHMPLIFLFGRLMPNSLFLNLFLIIVFAFSISTFLEYFYQKSINSFFKKQ